MADEPRFDRDGDGLHKKLYETLAEALAELGMSVGEVIDKAKAKRAEKQGA